MQVRRLPRTTGTAGWNAILPPPPPAAPLAGAITADWLVIGAGFAGLAAARRLAQLHPDSRIVILEAGRVGEGPAGRNSGFMIDLPHDLASANYGGDSARDAAQTEANRRAIAFALEAAAEFELPAEAIVRSGKVNAAATERGLAHNRSYGAHLTRLGEACTFLDAAQMRDLTGSSYYRGGLFTPGTAMLQPALFVRLLAAGLQAQGVAVHEHSPVTALTREGNAWRATTEHGAVSASAVILAVNGHAESFGRFTRRLVHVHLYASMTRPLAADEACRLGGEPVWGLTPADPMGTTVRRIRGADGDRIIVRNRCHYTPDLQTDEHRLEKAARSHDRSFACRFPALDGVTMQYRWAGALCLSLNDAPAWGELEPGLFAACCQNGLGLARGTLGGLAAAELASNIDNETTRHLSAQPPPSPLPPSPLAALGAGARIRWGEWQAGGEL